MFWGRCVLARQALTKERRCSLQFLGGGCYFGLLPMPNCRALVLGHYTTWNADYDSGHTLQGVPPTNLPSLREARRHRPMRHALCQVFSRSAKQETGITWVQNMCFTISSCIGSGGPPIPDWPVGGSPDAMSQTAPVAASDDQVAPDASR